MIRQLVLGLLLWIPAVLLGAAPAEAQYMFLDFDGDGQYTTYDQYGGYSYGDSARVDLYVVTNEVQPGVPGSPCTDDGSAASINGYTVNLYVGHVSSWQVPPHEHGPHLRIRLSCPRNRPHLMLLAAWGDHVDLVELHRQ
jgi:hypothetical protein